MRLFKEMIKLDSALIDNIQRKDGSLFVVKPFSRKGSPLDVPGVDIGISREEIVDVLREVRKH